MQGVLNDSVLAEYRENGFVRTGIHVPTELLSRVHATYKAMPSSASNWSYFGTTSLDKSISGKGRAKLRWHLVRKFAPWVLHLHTRLVLYRKAIFGSSDALPDVLEACLDQGLAGCLGAIPFLVGHDLYLEQDRKQLSFGFHEDGFAWAKLFQTDDDVSLYIPLQDLAEETGGRLKVHSKPEESAMHRKRNDDIILFSSYCREFVEPDQNGLITRESLEKCPHHRKIGEEHTRLSKRRREPPYPEPGDMNPIDARKGEVILFNNKRFHDVERWKLDTPRAIYAIRLFPLYDIGFAPPTNFLDGARCNRYLLDAREVTLSLFDCERDRSRFIPVPQRPSAV